MSSMTSSLLLIIGTWLLSDAVYSIFLYLRAPAWNGERKQTWAGDHWIRVVRAGCALAIIYVGLFQ